MSTNPRLYAVRTRVFVRQALLVSVEIHQSCIHRCKTANNMDARCLYSPPPLRDTAVKNAKPKEKTYTMGDGEGMYLKITPNGSRFWRMQYRQANGKPNRLTFGKYPEVTLAQARNRRVTARKLLDQGIDLCLDKRDKKLTQANTEANTFEVVARQRLGKTAARRSNVTQAKVTSWLENNVFSVIGRKPIPSIVRVTFFPPYG